MQEREQFIGLILAAGLGKRLRASPDDTFPKVLREINGRPMIAYVIDAMRGAGVNEVCVVVGSGGDTVRSSLGGKLMYAHQKNQIGSGDAAASAKSVLEGKSEHIIVMCGDSPLFTAETVASLKQEHVLQNAAVTLAAAELADPTGYGRILRVDGKITGVVEEKCATPEQRKIREVNGGCYAFESDWLWSNIHRIQPNDTGEYCLTDMVAFAISDGRTVAAVRTGPEEALGVNTPEQLHEAEEILRGRRTGFVATPRGEGEC